MAFLKCAQCGQLYTTKWKLEEHRVTRHLQPNQALVVVKDEPVCPARPARKCSRPSKDEGCVSFRPLDCFFCQRSVPQNMMVRHVVRHHLAELKQFISSLPSRRAKQEAYEAAGYAMPVLMCPCCRHEWRICNSRAVELHINKHIRAFSGSYTCLTCYRVITGMTEFRAHNRKPHCLRCCDCELSFACLSHLAAHRRTAHAELKYMPCRYEGCGQKFLFVYQLVQHQRMHMVSCRLCRKLFESQDQVEVHARWAHMKSGVWPCRHCLATFNDAEDLVQHRQSTHYVFECPKMGCNYRAISYELVEQHKKRHLETRPFCCFRCQRTFSHRDSYKSHLIRVHNFNRVSRRVLRLMDRIARARPGCCVKDEPLSLIY